MPENNTGPVAALAVTQQGSTFADRKAAREAAEKPSAKQVDSEATEVEDKAVAKKSARKRG